MKRPPKLYSPVRRWARRVVWAVFVLVVVARVLMPRDPMMRGRGPFGGFPQGGPVVQQRMQGRWRVPSRLQAPVADVPTNLWRIQIEIPARDIAALQRTSFEWRRGPRDERPEVLVTVREGGTVHTNVALHLKGSAGSFRPFDDKPAMTLNFSKHAKGQSFHGYPKISLNNSVQDPSLVSEALARELFVAAGVPVPHTEHGTVLVNGRDLGLYVVAEGWGKPFLRKHFKNADGNLYDGGFVQDIDANLAVNSGDDGPGRVELNRLLEAVRNPDRSGRWERLREVLDVDRFASLLALEVMICHWDGYGLNRNNYRVFHDRSTGRIVFMPHGMDQIFGRGGRMGGAASVQPGMHGMVARSFMSTAEGRRLYFTKVRQLYADHFADDRLVRRAQELSSEIEPTLAAYGRGYGEEQRMGLEELCRGIRSRTASIADQIKRPNEPVDFSDQGVLQLKSWKSRLNPQGRSGQAGFERAEVDGRSCLVIRASREGASGSWRTQVLLGAGRYRFEGLVRTEGVGSTGGVCLRVSASPRNFVTGHDGEWLGLSYRFVVDESAADVEMVCEFDAANGTAAFDEGTLRLVRE